MCCQLFSAPLRPARPGKYPAAVLFPVRCGRQLPGGSYQLPVLVLAADFGSPPDADGGEAGDPAVLSFAQLRTLLHEMGHAVHCLVSRTRYQHLWGTR
jgi:intermediate peptidase